MNWSCQLSVYSKIVLSACNTVAKNRHSISSFPIRKASWQSYYFMHCVHMFEGSWSLLTDNSRLVRPCRRVILKNKNMFAAHIFSIAVMYCPFLLPILSWEGCFIASARSISGEAERESCSKNRCLSLCEEPAKQISFTRFMCSVWIWQVSQKHHDHILYPFCQFCCLQCLICLTFQVLAHWCPKCTLLTQSGQMHSRNVFLQFFPFSTLMLTTYIHSQSMSAFKSHFKS